MIIEQCKCRFVASNECESIKKETFIEYKSLKNMSIASTPNQQKVVLELAHHTNSMQFRSYMVRIQSVFSA